MGTSVENSESVQRLSVSENPSGESVHQAVPCASPDTLDETRPRLELNLGLSPSALNQVKQDKHIKPKPCSTSLPTCKSRSQGAHKPTMTQATTANGKTRKCSPKKFPHRKLNEGDCKKLKTTSATAETASSFPDDTEDQEEKGDNSLDKGKRGDNPHDKLQTPCGDSVLAFLDTEDFEDTQATMLAAQMGQNTFGYMGALPVHGGQVSPERSKVIHDILKNFDLEQVMSRYRGSTVSKNTHLSSCLEEIMGRERAPFDDQRWNDKLRKKVMADLERRLDENERELEEAENRRILKLKLMGIYHGETLEEDERRRHVHKPNKKTAAERKLEKRNKMARESLFRPSEDIVTQMEILHRDDDQVKKGNSDNGSSSDISNNNNYNQNNVEVHTSAIEAEATNESGSPDVTKEEQSQDIDEEQTRDQLRHHMTHTQLRKLFQEEDLRELYKEAENLVRLSQVSKK